MASGEDSPADNRSPLGRVGFESGSDIYERARPSYPPAAVAHLEATCAIGPGTVVLDLAAGTGKLTRQLAADGAVCIGIEPSASMREVFQRMVEGAVAIAGTAEAIPLADRAVQAVVVAQAFHWFDPQVALVEMARVLVPGGWLALLWNERDEADHSMAELVRISKWDHNQPYPMGHDFGVRIDESGLFGPVERSRFSFVQWLGLGEFVDQVASRSYVRVLPEAERQALLEQVATYGATLGDPIPMPYVTDLFCAQLTTS
jgi:SAM-dependent methyltransferase